MKKRDEKIADKYVTDFENFLVSIKLFSENTRNAYIQDIKDLKEYLRENFKISLLEVESYHLENYIQELRLKNFKPSSINRKISSIKRFYNFIYKKNLVNKDPSYILKTLKKGKKLPSFFTDNEIFEFLNYLKNEYEKSNDIFDLRDYLIFELLVGSGLRVSELINLSFSSISTIGKVIRVYGKGGKFRIVPISETFLKYFLIYKKELLILLESKKNKYIDCKKDINNKKIFNKGNLNKDYSNDINKNDFIFLNKKLRKMTRGGVFFIIKKRFLSWGKNNSNIFPHKLRHTFATLLLQNGADIRFIQKLLGHSSLASTEVYTHLDIERKKRIYKEFHPHG
ncbi:MAG: tyrosine-type recombinase/integrase [Spirochaetes bacterium]|nr:tyrosine-type recombinase/integrase [Spirochaetota bacterium]